MPADVLSDTSDEAWPIALNVTMSVPYLFQGATVQFQRFAHLNYLIGPNGSGKSTLFTQIMRAARGQWPRAVKVLGTGRLGTLEKSVERIWGSRLPTLMMDDNITTVYERQFQEGHDVAHDAFLLLEKRLDLRLRVTALLRHVFGRDIHLKSTRQGLQVFASRAGVTSEYPVIDECHGLKELITILTFLYDDRFKVLGIDEPELHLHPQFQRFLLSELRKATEHEDVTKRKVVFLVTHSPILVDLRSDKDLASIILFSGPEKPPTRVTLTELSSEARQKLRRAVPAIHAAQREALFSKTPIFVEGPTDLAIVTGVCSRLDLPLGAAGIGLAQMGGKMQLPAFRAWMASLGVKTAHFVLDLDAALDTKLLHEIEDDPTIRSTLAAAGAGTSTLSQQSGELRRLLNELIKKLSGAGKRIPHPEFPAIENMSLASASDAAAVLRALNECPVQALGELGIDSDLEAIRGKLDLIVKACRAGRVLVLRRGTIEAYYATSCAIRAKDFRKQQAFEEELARVFEADLRDLETRYGEILEFIRAAGLLAIPLADVLATHIADLVHELQKCILTGTLKDLGSVPALPALQAAGLLQIATVTHLAVDSPRNFRGTVKVHPELGGASIEFNQDTKAFELAQRSVRGG